MEKVQGRTFSNEAVVLDGKDFDGCKFENCQLIYRATDSVSMANCSFFGFTFVFEGAAGSTLDFLTKLYRGGFQSTVEQTFTNIRTGSSPTGGTPPSRWTVQ